MKLRVLLGVINLVRKPCFLLFLLWFQQGEAIIAVEHPWAWVPMGLEEELSPLWGDPVAKGSQTSTTHRLKMSRKQSHYVALFCVSEQLFGAYDTVFELLPGNQKEMYSSRYLRYQNRDILQVRGISTSACPCLTEVVALFVCELLTRKV